MKPQGFRLILLSLFGVLLLSWSLNFEAFSDFNLGTLEVQAQPTSPTPQPSPNITPAPSSTVDPLPLSETTYIDPLGRFQIGILQDYNVTTAGNWPLIESPDGSLAYTVIVKSRESDRIIPSPSLAQIAIETFEQGEDFQPGTYQAIALNEISMPWTGNVTTGSTTQPLQGKIRVRQDGQNLLILLVSATEVATEKIDPAIVTIANSLTAK